MHDFPSAVLWMQSLGRLYPLLPISLPLYKNAGLHQKLSFVFKSLSLALRSLEHSLPARSETSISYPQNTWKSTIPRQARNRAGRPDHQISISDFQNSKSYCLAAWRPPAGVYPSGTSKRAGSGSARVTPVTIIVTLPFRGS
jgi:hypothetical protein